LARQRERISVIVPKRRPHHIVNQVKRIKIRIKVRSIGIIEQERGPRNSTHPRADFLAQAILDPTRERHVSVHKSRAVALQLPPNKRARALMGKAEKMRQFLRWLLDNREQAGVAEGVGCAAPSRVKL
jgi:hypothetical protein